MSIWGTDVHVRADLCRDVLRWCRAYPALGEIIACMDPAGGGMQRWPAEIASLSNDVSITSVVWATLSSTCFWLWGLWCDSLSSAYQPPARGSGPPRGPTPHNAQESALCPAQTAEEMNHEQTLYIARFVQMNEMRHALQIKEKHHSLKKKKEKDINQKMI